MSLAQCEWHLVPKGGPEEELPIYLLDAQGSPIFLQSPSAPLTHIWWLKEMQRGLWTVLAFKCIPFLLWSTFETLYLSHLEICECFAVALNRYCTSPGKTGPKAPEIKTDLPGNFVLAMETSFACDKAKNNARVTEMTYCKGYIPKMKIPSVLFSNRS